MSPIFYFFFATLVDGGNILLNSFPVLKSDFYVLAAKMGLKIAIKLLFNLHKPQTGRACNLQSIVHLSD
jgi:hypothetical protein